MKFFTKQNIFKIVAVYFVFSFALAPLIVLAVGETPESVEPAQTVQEPSGSSNTTNIQKSSTETNSLKNTAGTGAAPQGIDPNSVSNPSLDGIGGAAVIAVGTCSIGQILSRFISSAIGVLVNTVIQKIKSVFFSVVDNLTTFTAVPVADNQTEKNTSAVSLKTTGIGHASLSGLLDWVGNVSLDSIMFCIVNEILTYITQATINWINSGFNGNPVFVQNPQALFQSIADQEASNFIHGLANGANQAVNQGANNLAYGVQQVAGQLFTPIRQQVVRTLIGGYNSTYESSITPTPVFLPSNQADYDAFLRGDKWYGVGALTEAFDPRYNAYGATLVASDELNARISQQQQIASLKYQTNNGYYSYSTCPPEHVRYDGSCDPLYLRDVTIGNQIKDELQSRNMMKYLRVSFAKDFDSVITALVNQLVRIAINKIYEGAGKATGAINGGR